MTLNQIAKIEDAGEGSLTFLANMEYEGFIYTTRASAALVSEHFAPSQALPKQLALIRVQDPYTAFAGVLQWAAASQAHPAGISSKAHVDPSAEIAQGCYIGPFVVVEAGAKIGTGCQIHSHVSIGRGVQIGPILPFIARPPSSIIAQSGAIASFSREQSSVRMASGLHPTAQASMTKCLKPVTSPSAMVVKSAPLQPLTALRSGRR